eukprot:CAMPEP_0172502462 /NCGR_PEP_ID=MMETSP1066-20121228/160249_1 /TAXON_ID=671091 /ORGANISM="Coscinodiscus wailesii, Strain CCMP2513" /LENGTH=294 /DNA_ID=CAMNT_0013277721 /DNA_START=58 /DNA_END=938 /DNA_ORIENTATION=+
MKYNKLVTVLRQRRHLKRRIDSKTRREEGPLWDEFFDNRDAKESEREGSTNLHWIRSYTQTTRNDTGLSLAPCPSESTDEIPECIIVANRKDKSKCKCAIGVSRSFEKNEMVKTSFFSDEGSGPDKPYTMLDSRGMMNSTFTHSETEYSHNEESNFCDECSTSTYRKIPEYVFIVETSTSTEIIAAQTQFLDEAEKVYELLESSLPEDVAEMTSGSELLQIRLSSDLISFDFYNQSCNVTTKNSSNKICAENDSALSCGRDQLSSESTSSSSAGSDSIDNSIDFFVENVNKGCT